MNNITVMTFPTLTRKQDGRWLTSWIPFKVGPASKKWLLGQIHGLMYHGIAIPSCNSYMSKISLTKIFLTAYMSPRAFHWAAHHSQPQPYHLCLSSSGSQRFSAVQCKVCCHQRWEAAPKPKHTILPSHLVCRHHSNSAKKSTRHEFSNLNAVHHDPTLLILAEVLFYESPTVALTSMEFLLPLVLQL
jgi:hypothetical protein